MGAGDTVRLKGDPGRVGVLTGKTRPSGPVAYAQVRFPTNSEYVPEDQLELVDAELDTPVELLARGRLAGPRDLRRTLTHIRLSGRLANFIYSLHTTETDFYAYQFKPVLKLLRSVGTGILIADEVGLGKTIEAGLIWTELRSRFDFEKLLVVCPAMLREKWARELQRRFGVRAEIVGAKELVDRLRAVDTGASQGYAAITSLQGLRPPRGWANDPTARGAKVDLARLLSDRAEDERLVDLLVIDEAHYLRNPETQSAELGALLRAVSEYAVLLSATPVHLRSEDLFHLLKVADPTAFNRKDVFEFLRKANEHLVGARDLVLAGAATPAELEVRLENALMHPLLHENRQLKALLEEVQGGEPVNPPQRRISIAARLEEANLFGHALTRTRRREVKEFRAVREPVTVKVTMSPLERDFYETVTATVRDYCERSGHSEGFLLVMPQRQMASSMAAAHWYWSQDDPGVLKELEEELGIDLPEPEAATMGPLISELRQRTARIGNLAALAQNDTKYEELKSQLKRLQSESPSEKVVLFSSFRHTLRYLHSRLGDDGITSTLLLGGAKDQEEVLEAFRDPGGPSVLLSSEVGSEGIDLQFARILVNYDLPWNPMRVEQRIGRLDRLGQQADRVAAWNILHRDTIDDRIYDRLFERLGIFRQTLGGLEGILGEEIQALTRDLFMAHLSPKQEEERIDQTETAVAQIRDTERRLEKDAASLVAYGEYITSQVAAARDLSRRISAEEIQRYTLDFLSQHYPGSLFVQDPEDPTVVEISLSPAGKNDLEAFLRQRRSAARTSLTGGGRTVRCRFENRMRVDVKGGEEAITQLHPLVRFVAQTAEEKAAVLRPAVAIAVRAADMADAWPLGDYLFGTVRLSFEALRPSEQLWFGAEPCGSREPGEPLSEEDAERFVNLAAALGAEWPGAAADLDGSQLAERAERLLERGFAALGGHEAHLRAQNEDLADAQLASLDAHEKHQATKYEALRQTHLAASNPGLAKAAERNLQKLRERVERERLRIKQRRRFRRSMDEVAIGIVRVSR